MPEFIDVMTIVDAKTIADKYPAGTAENPTMVSGGLIYMITNAKNAMSGNTGNELRLSANTNDIIRWHMNTLSSNTDYDGILYGFDASAGGELISTPEADLVDVKVPLPNDNDPLHPNSQQIKDYYWQCTVKSPGDTTYHFRFMVTDKKGNVKGYYWWDPFIHIEA